MKKLESYTAEEVAEKISAKEIESAISKTSPEHISAIVEALGKGNVSGWAEKTRAVVFGLSNRPQLETVGSALSVSQALDLIDHHQALGTKKLWKLSPLLVGISHPSFMQLLLSASDKQLEVLKQEAVTEPVQHHLNLIAHEMAHSMEEFSPNLQGLEQTIENLNPTSLTLEEFQEITHSLHVVNRALDTCKRIINQALAIAWNSNRIDLIEQLNSVKRIIENSSLLVGMPQSHSSPATGFCKNLEMHLFAVYGNPLDAGDIGALNDTEPAIEGLVRLGIQYLKDYFDIGLLPHIQEKDLTLDPETHSESECVQHREQLFSQAIKNLEKTGLSTVGDLKEAMIFSRDTLKNHLELSKNSIS